MRYLSTLKNSIFLYFKSHLIHVSIPKSSMILINLWVLELCMCYPRYWIELIIDDPDHGTKYCATYLSVMFCDFLIQLICASWWWYRARSMLLIHAFIILSFLLYMLMVNGIPLRLYYVVDVWINVLRLFNSEDLNATLIIW